MALQSCWSTQHILPQGRRDFWVEAISDAFVPLDCASDRPPEQFHGEIEAHRLDMLTLSRVHSCGQRVARTSAQIARTGQDMFLVSLQLRGEATIVQEARSATLLPGDFALYDSTRPYELIFNDEFEQVVLAMPGPLLRNRIPSAETLTARRVAGGRGVGQLFCGLVTQLVADFETLPPSSIAALSASIENILLAGLASLDPAAGAGGPANAAMLRRDQIKAYVTENLRDPCLSVDSIAASLRVAPSTVHRSFAGERSSLNSWIWARRLDNARSELCDPRFANRTITDIAFGWGFNDTAHFSRAFRNRFGCAPRDLRAGSLGQRELQS